jgi:hypothetical protein
LEFGNWWTGTRMDEWPPNCPLRWPIGVWELVDWDAHGRVAAKLSPEQHTRYVKVAHDWLPTRHHLCTIDPEQDDHCPLCHRLREDSKHVMRCNAEIAQNARAIGLSKLRQTWQGQRTPHALQDVFESGLIQWCRLTQDTGPAIQCPQTKPDKYGNLLQIAFKEQTSIGWDNAWKRWISKRRGEAVAQHYRQCDYGEIYNAKRWTQSTVK